MAEDLKELDSVALLNDLPAHRLRRGQVGTVVMIHDAEAAEVEFVDEQGKTYALIAVPKSQLMRLHHHYVDAIG